MFGWLKNLGQKLNNSYANDNRFNSGRPNMNISSTPVRKTTAKPKTANQNLGNLGLSTSWSGGGQQSKVGNQPARKPAAPAAKAPARPAAKAPAPRPGVAGVARAGGSSGGGGYGGGSGGGGGSIGAPAAVKPVLDLGVWKADTSNMNVYNPDFAAFNKAQQDILGAFGNQRDVFNQQAATQRQDLQQRMQQLIAEQDRAKQDSQRNFALTRKDIQDSVFDAQRQDQAAAASRGLADSGAAQLGEIQRRMAEGDALSQTASDYYDAEDSILRARKETKENHDIAEQQVENSLAEAMSNLLNMETQQKSQYTSQMDGLKRQLQQDTNQLETVKNQYGREHIVDSNQKKTLEAQFAQAERDFAFRQQQAAEQAALARQAQAAQASRWQQEFGLKQQQFNAAQQAAAGQLDGLDQYDVYDYIAKNNMTEAQANRFIQDKAPGSGASWGGAMDYMGLGQKDKKKSGLAGWFGSLTK